MNTYIHRFIHYLRYRYRAKNAFGIHSPFVYHLYSFLQNNRKQAFQTINHLYKTVIQIISKANIGDEMLNQADHKTLIRDIWRVSVPPKHAVIPYMFVQYAKPKSILEFGTGFGISTIFIKAAAPDAVIHTIDHNHKRLSIARYLFQSLHYTSIHTYHLTFNEFLRACLHTDLQPDMIFIDGDHCGERLIDYIHQLLPCIRNSTIILLHDIYWSADMTTAWERLIHFPQVTISLDLYNFGVLMFRQGIYKQHFQLLV